MSERPAALVDSNVIIAALIQDHLHHHASRALVGGLRGGRFAVAAHSLAEVYVSLTRQGPTGFGWYAEEARVSLEHLASTHVLLGLTPAQTLESLRLYAAAGGIGARLYDHLIGRAAVLHGIGAIITWNIRHMRALFPALLVTTPEEAGAVHS